jgi:hypothetical protein
MAFVLANFATDDRDAVAWGEVGAGQYPCYSSAGWPWLVNYQFAIWWGVDRRSDHRVAVCPQGSPRGVSLMGPPEFLTETRRRFRTAWRHSLKKG